MERFLTINDYGCLMAGNNRLLEYTIDTLLYTFNPENKPIVRKASFYKMMDILSFRLRKQGINIEYPSFWYKYGSVTDFRYLDQIIQNGFTTRYFDGENIFFPSCHRRSYNIDPQSQYIINSTIKFFCKQYQYKKDYSELLKKESYKLNSPYSFNTVFQEFIKVVDNKNQFTLLPKKEILEPLLDKLLVEFPEDDFPELLDINLAWDDTTRLVLDHLDKSTEDYLKTLMYLFWDVYSKGIRSIYNWYFPVDYVINWKQEYEKSLPEVEKKIEELRKELFVKHNYKFNTDEDLVRKLLKTAYNLSV
jgi:hypothetical protein